MSRQISFTDDAYIDLPRIICSDEGAPDITMWADNVSYFWRSVRQDLHNGVSVYHPKLVRSVNSYNFGLRFLRDACAVIS